MIFASRIAKPSVTTPISADNALGQILLVTVAGIEVMGREPAGKVGALGRYPKFNDEYERARTAITIESGGAHLVSLSKVCRPLCH